MFYLVKDGTRTVTLAAEKESKLYGFVPEFQSFVYNKPMTIDFQIDREMTYEPVDTNRAAEIVRAGEIGMSNSMVLELLKLEARRLDPGQLGLL